MRKRQLLIDNERLRAECSYLRGRVVELQRGQAEIVGHVRGLVSDTLHSFLPDPLAQPPSPPLTERTDEGEDWTDQLAPRTLTDEQVAEYSHALNDALVIGDANGRE